MNDGLFFVTKNHNVLTSITKSDRASTSKKLSAVWKERIPFIKDGCFRLLTRRWA